MQAAALYGLLLVLVFEVFTQDLPQPGGSIVMWALFASQLTWASVICWRRTGLLLTTFSMGMGAASCACFAVLAANGRVSPLFRRRCGFQLESSWPPVLFSSRSNPG